MKEPFIQTVLGPLAPSSLGFTSMHEHIFFQGSVLARRLRAHIPAHAIPIQEDDKVCLENVGLLLNNSILATDALIQDDEQVMTKEIADFAATGGQAILEVSAPGIQLITEPLARVSQATGVHIIISTGFYTWDSWPKAYQDQPIDFYRRHMLQEIRHGVQGTPYLPGHLKIALNDLNQMEENALRAAARAGLETGLALTIHPCNKPGGDRLRVLDILEQEQFPLERVVMAHTSLEQRPSSYKELLYHPELYRVDTETAKRLIDRGANISIEFCNPLGFEMMGRCRFGDLGQMAGLYELISQGYAGRIVLGNDVCGRTMLRRGGALGYLRLTTFVIPTLREVAGVSDYAIRQMMVENPARILAIND